MKNNSPSINTIREMRKELKNNLVQHWLNDTFLHWQWWFLIIVLIVPCLIWWKLVDKKRLHIIFTFGLLILIFNSFLDDIGTGSVWWFYPHKIIPTLNILKAPDWALVPCGMMLVFQYSKTWKRFLILNFLLSLLFALIGEPLFISLGLYELVSWNLIYSILHYNIVGFLARWIVLKIHKIST